MLNSEKKSESSLSTRESISIEYLCIHLMSMPERARIVAESAEKAGIHIDFIEAITPDAAEILHQGYNAKRREKHRLPMLPPEHACLQSHRKALETFLKSSSSHVVVLEDDAAFDADIDSILREIILAIPSVDWLKLEQRNPKKHPIVLKHDTWSVMLPFNASNGATAILYSKLGARNVVESLSDYIFPFDTHSNTLFLRGLTMLSVTPAICWENHLFESTTGVKICDRKDDLRSCFVLRFGRIKQSVIKRIYGIILMMKFKIT